MFGGSGLVGSRFIDLYHKDRLTITPKSKEVDITKKESLGNFFKENEKNFDTVINFAAYTNVDEAEKERGKKNGICWKINVEGVKNIAEACKDNGKYLIHISTDFIFPGNSDYPGPYSEDSRLPQNGDGIGWYGWTKLEGEKALKELFENYAVVRIASPYRGHFTEKLDFARNILNLFDEERLYPMFADKKFTPTFIDELSKVLYLLTEEKKKGIFHVVSTDITTPYEFASYLLEKARGSKGIVKKGSQAELNEKTGVPRPILGGLKTEITQKELGITLMTWRKAINEFVIQLG